MSCSVLRGRRVQSESCCDLSRALPEDRGRGGGKGINRRYIYLYTYTYTYRCIGVGELFCA